MITTETTLDNTYDLIAHVYRRALKDARRGDKEAIGFLNVSCPDWQELASQSKRVARERKAKSTTVFL
jgi:hypothetical protein